MLLAAGLISVWAQPAQAQATEAQAAQAIPTSFVALSDEQILLLEHGLTKTEANTLVNDYLTILTAQYAQRYNFPDTLIELFDSEPEIRNIFISALEPDHDDIARAAHIFDDLNTIDPDRLKQYVHLAVAIAVVYDQPRRFYRELEWVTYLVERSQFPASVSPEDIYEYYTNPPRSHNFVFDPDDLPWPMLVYIIDNQVNASDRRWAHQSRSSSISSLYSGVEYDYDKQDEKIANLGDRPYTLQNIQEYGGVCADQAYFASRAGKTFGIPAMVACGKNRYGGSHAWVGYLVMSRGKAHLEFTGRYFNDHYYTGSVACPQTGQMLLDRHVAMMFDGMSVSYPSYQRSRVLFRMAEIMRPSQPTESLVITEYALINNPYLPEGWQLLMSHFRNDTLNKKDALKWFNKMLKILKDHPDITFECIETFIDCYSADDLKSREKMYRQAWDIYDSRPDLQFDICITLAREMSMAGKERKALEMLLKVIGRYASEGSVVLPATHLAVQYARDLGFERTAYKELRKARDNFPRLRRGSDSPTRAYLAFEEAIESLLE